MRVRRLDLATTLAAPVRRADGTIVVEGRIARSGVQTYRNADGSTRVEYRPDAEVARSMQSMKLVPVTNDHPPGMGDASSWRSLAVGAIGENVRRDGAWIVAPLAIFDAHTISAMERGKNQISAGYECELDETPGTAPDGTRYDAVQRSITINHVAIVDNARAGKDAAARMDAAYVTDDEPAAPAESNVMDPELLAACTEHGIKADDERAAALALLNKLGLPGSHETTSGGRLDSKSDAYLVARAVSKARGYADELKIRTAAQRWGYGTEQKRVDRSDGERQDDEREDDDRFDAGEPRYDARHGDELYDGMDIDLVPGALRFDKDGQLIGDYYRSDAVEEARQKLREDNAAMCPWPGETPEQAVQRIRIDAQAADVAQRFGTGRRANVSAEQLEGERAKTAKARQDMIESRPRRVADPLAVTGSKEPK